MSEEKGLHVYESNGTQIKLSEKIVHEFLVRGNGKVSDQEASLFIGLCKFNKLNPFLNEAYLVKYGEGAATMVVSREAFMKRADSCIAYEGIESGICVQRGDVIIDIEGALLLESDKLIGAWAKVYRSDRKYPFVSKITFSEYVQKTKDGKINKFWSEKPATMAVKVAEVQALKKAFPNELGGMQVSDEVTIDTPHEDISERKVNTEIIIQSEPKKVDISKL